MHFSKVSFHFSGFVTHISADVIKKISTMKNTGMVEKWNIGILGGEIGILPI
jgi:hypothetical protein